MLQSCGHNRPDEAAIVLASRTSQACLSLTVDQAERRYHGPCIASVRPTILAEHLVLSSSHEARFFEQ